MNQRTNGALDPRRWHPGPLRDDLPLLHDDFPVGGEAEPPEAEVGRERFFVNVTGAGKRARKDAPGFRPPMDRQQQEPL